MFLPKHALTGAKPITSKEDIERILNNMILPRYEAVYMDDIRLGMFMQDALELFKCYFDYGMFSETNLHRTEVPDLIRKFLMGVIPGMTHSGTLAITYIAAVDPVYWGHKHLGQDITVRNGFECECGADAAKTTHSDWCPVKNN